MIVKELDQGFGLDGVAFRSVGLGQHSVDHVESTGFQHREGFVELAVLAGPGICSYFLDLPVLWLL